MKIELTSSYVDAAREAFQRAIGPVSGWADGSGR
jgi:hypothetical protein